MGIAWITAGPCGRSSTDKLEEARCAVGPEGEPADGVVADLLQDGRVLQCMEDVRRLHPVPEGRRKDLHTQVS